MIRGVIDILTALLCTTVCTAVCAAVCTTVCTAVYTPVCAAVCAAVCTTVIAASCLLCTSWHCVRALLACYQALTVSWPMRLSMALMEILSLMLSPPQSSALLRGLPGNGIVSYWRRNERFVC